MHTEQKHSTCKSSHGKAIHKAQKHCKAKQPIAVQTQTWIHHHYLHLARPMFLFCLIWCFMAFVFVVIEHLLPKKKYRSFFVGIFYLINVILKNSNKLKCSSKDKFTTANWSHKVCSGCFIFKTIILCRSKLFQKISPTKQIIRFNCRWWENS